MSRENIPTTVLWGTAAGLMNNNYQELYEGMQTAQVSITHPSPAFTIPVTGTGDEDLDPSVYAANYIDVLNGYSEAFNNGNVFSTLADGRMQINASGTVIISGYADISHSSNGATVGIVFSIERGAAMVLSPRAVHTRMPNAGNIGNLTGMGALSVVTGDIIGVAVASDTTGSVSFRSSSLVYEFKGPAQ